MMSISNDKANVLDDYEEGEILDDDSPVCSQENFSRGRLIDINVAKIIEIDKVNGETSFSDNSNHSPIIKSAVMKRAKDISIKSEFNEGRRRTPIFREYRNFPGKRRSGSGRPRPNIPRHRRIGLGDRIIYRTKKEFNYERRLRDFEKIKCKKGDRNNFTDSLKKNAGLVKTKETETSLLQRLVSSGSIGIKVLKESDHCEGEPVDRLDNEQITNNVSVKALHTGSTEDFKDKTLSNKLQEISADDSGKNESDDEDELNLRMKALKTAMLKKHMKRLKEGVTLKKKTNEHKSYVHKTISNLVSEGDLQEADNCEFNEINNVNESIHSGSEMSLDSNYLSDHSNDLSTQSIANDLDKSFDNAGIESIKTEVSKVGQQMENINKHSLDSNDDLTSKPKRLKTESNEVTDDDDEFACEMELRKLALMSFWMKSKENQTTERDDVGEKISCSMDCDMRDWRDLEKVNEKVERFKREYCEGKKIEEDWEEVDEDILRAQLLQTLSINLPDQGSKKRDKNIQEKQVSTKVTTKSVTSTSLNKKDIDKDLERQSKLWSEKMVPKLVISLESDSESDFEELEKSVDRFLMEARINSEISSDLPKPTSTLKVPKIPQKKVNRIPRSKSSVSVTPVAVKHLPIHQQEEYRRLKIKLAEKERLRRKVMKKVLEANKEDRVKDEKDQKESQRKRIVMELPKILDSEVVEKKQLNGEGKVENEESKYFSMRRSIDVELEALSVFAREAEEARARYNESIDRVSRLKRELQDAEERVALDARLLLDQGSKARGQWQTCSNLIQQWISSCKTAVTTDKELVSARLSQEYSRATNATSFQPKSQSKQTWDPDEVLCPYQLAGSCKDSACPFLHIKPS